MRLVPQRRDSRTRQAAHRFHSEFTWYAANFGSYNKTYGSLGAVIGFMVWIWISTIVILLGAEIDAEMERRTVRDATA